MNNLILFTDGSVDAKTHIGFGAYLVIENPEIPAVDLIAKVKTKQFENTSSTLLEVQTLLWAIEDGISSDYEKKIYEKKDKINNLYRLTKYFRLINTAKKVRRN